MWLKQLSDVTIHSNQNAIQFRFHDYNFSQFRITNWNLGQIIKEKASFYVFSDKKEKKNAVIF